MSLEDKIEYRHLAYKNTPFECVSAENVKQAVNELHSRLKLKANKQQCLTHDDIRDIFGEFKDE